MQELNPFVNWVGGKTPIIQSLLDNTPKNIVNYYEPFVGSGKLLLTLKPKNKNVINDINPQLMNTYKVIRDNPNELIKWLETYEDKNTKKDYYYNREIYNDHINFYKKTQVEQAAIFLYLTHANYRGLYRVNKKGGFNVGYGNRPTREFLIDYSNIINISEFLKDKCEILCGNFIDAINSCQRDDFIYLDSPYYQSFNQYDKKKFTKKDFESMKESVKELDRKGCKVLISNNDNEYIIQLFKEYEIVKIKAPNNVNAADKIKRKVIKRSEILIKNY